MLNSLFSLDEKALLMLEGSYFIVAVKQPTIEFLICKYALYLYMKTTLFYENYTFSLIIGDTSFINFIFLENKERLSFFNKVKKKCIFSTKNEHAELFLLMFDNPSIFNFIFKKHNVCNLKQLFFEEMGNKLNDFFLIVFDNYSFLLFLEYNNLNFKFKKKNSDEIFLLYFDDNSFNLFFLNKFFFEKFNFLNNVNPTFLLALDNFSFIEFNLFFFKDNLEKFNFLNNVNPTFLLALDNFSFIEFNLSKIKKSSGFAPLAKLKANCKFNENILLFYENYTFINFLLVRFNPTLNLDDFYFFFFLKKFYFLQKIKSSLNLTFFLVAEDSFFFYINLKNIKKENLFLNFLRAEETFFLVVEDNSFLIKYLSNNSFNFKTAMLISVVNNNKDLLFFLEKDLLFLNFNFINFFDEIFFLLFFSKYQVTQFFKNNLSITFLLVAEDNFFTYINLKNVKEKDLILLSPDITSLKNNETSLLFSYNTSFLLTCLYNSDLNLSLVFDNCCFIGVLFKYLFFNYLNKNISDSSVLMLGELSYSYHIIFYFNNLDVKQILFHFTKNLNKELFLIQFENFSLINYYFTSSNLSIKLFLLDGNKLVYKINLLFFKDTSFLNFIFLKKDNSHYQNFLLTTEDSFFFNLIFFDFKELKFITFFDKVCFLFFYKKYFFFKNIHVNINEFSLLLADDLSYPYFLLFELNNLKHEKFVYVFWKNLFLTTNNIFYDQNSTSVSRELSLLIWEDTSFLNSVLFNSQKINFSLLLDECCFIFIYKKYFFLKYVYFCTNNFLFFLTNSSSFFNFILFKFSDINLNNLLILFYRYTYSNVNEFFLLPFDDISFFNFIFAELNNLNFRKYLLNYFINIYINETFLLPQDNYTFLSFIFFNLKEKGLVFFFKLDETSLLMCDDNFFLNILFLYNEEGLYFFRKLHIFFLLNKNVWFGHAYENKNYTILLFLDDISFLNLTFLDDRSFDRTYYFVNEDASLLINDNSFLNYMLLYSKELTLEKVYDKDTQKIKIFTEPKSLNYGVLFKIKELSSLVALEIYRNFFFITPKKYEYSLLLLDEITFNFFIYTGYFDFFKNLIYIDYLYEIRQKNKYKGIITSYFNKVNNSYILEICNNSRSTTNNIFHFNKTIKLLSSPTDYNYHFLTGFWTFCYNENKEFTKNILFTNENSVYVYKNYNSNTFEERSLFYPSIATKYKETSQNFNETFINFIVLKNKDFFYQNLIILKPFFKKWHFLDNYFSYPSIFNFQLLKNYSVTNFNWNTWEMYKQVALCSICKKKVWALCNINIMLYPAIELPQRDFTFTWSQPYLFESRHPRYQKFSFFYKIFTSAAEEIQYTPRRALFLWIPKKDILYATCEAAKATDYYFIPTMRWYFIPLVLTGGLYYISKIGWLL